MRTSSSPARARTRRQGSNRLDSLAPGFAPGITQGLSERRGIAARTATASGESETVRGPVLESRSLQLLRL